jgi:GT2 family glycosyltransferase
MKDQIIAPSPSQYSMLDDKTLDEVAKLVLSQQYQGEDIIKLQNETIHTLYGRIDELTELADLKKRVKNKIKQYLPTSMFKLLKNSKKILLTVKRNPQVLKKVLFYLKRGEIRYLLTKINEKSQNNLERYRTLVPLNPVEAIQPFKQRHFSLEEHRIDIIIPVYNGFEYLSPLFESIERYSTTPYRLIVINDASPDERVVPLIEDQLKKHPDAIFVNHSENVGFVKSVNEAVTHVSDHFIILNTDTEVPAFWIERLMYPIIHMEKVASTTPFTNAGQIASFPTFIEDNDIFEGMPVNTLDKVFRNVNPQAFYTEIPTGVGFCMGVNHTLVKEIGFFDEDTFGKGYGEENDWCQRAITHGYKNLLVPNLFVYHKHGGSFSSEEKKRLMAENAAKLLKRHPDYDHAVQVYVKEDPHYDLRRLLVMIASSKTEEGMYLIIDHALGGGANHYAQDRFETYHLSGKKVLYIQYDFYADRFVCKFRYKEYLFDFYLEHISGAEQLLREITFQELFVNSLVSYREISRMLALIKELSEVSNADLIVPIHDYYPVCPNFTLLNEQDSFCQIPDNLQQCKTCMQHDAHEWKAFGNADADISIWRNDWYTLLEVATTVLCFSNSSKTIILKAYPSLSADKIKIEPHKVSPLPPVNTVSGSSSETLTIGILGAINHAKGAGVIKTLVATIEERSLPIRIVLIGEISEYIKSPHFEVTGHYNRENLPNLVIQHGIDLFMIPSICPETFSYTTQEIMTMQMPLMVFDIGAPAERVKSYEKGYIIPHTDTETILQAVSLFQSQQKG